MSNNTPAVWRTTLESVVPTKYGISLLAETIAEQVKAGEQEPLAVAIRLTAIESLAKQARELIAALDKRRFLEELNRLASSFAADPGNPGSYACKSCVRCANCMFCEGCVGCYGCTHCVSCEQCNNCSHCVDSKSLNACAYCVQSENCANSAYVYFSKSLADCTYCFGCVGLSKKDFHILNVPFSRNEYFELTKKLKRELGIK